MYIIPFEYYVIALNIAQDQVKPFAGPQAFFEYCLLKHECQPWLSRTTYVISIGPENG